MTNLASIITLINHIISKQMTLQWELQNQKSFWETFQGNGMIEWYEYSDTMWYSMIHWYTSIEMRPGMTIRRALDTKDQGWIKDDLAASSPVVFARNICIWIRSISSRSSTLSKDAFKPSCRHFFGTHNKPELGDGWWWMVMDGDGWSDKRLYFTDVCPTQLSSIHLSVSKF